MTEETTDVSAEVTPAQDNVQISIEQIAAAIIATQGTIVVPVANLLTNYSDKSISVNQDPDTKDLIFALADNPAVTTEDVVEATEDVE